MSGIGRDKKFEPRLITFDFGDTIVTSEPSYLERISLGLCELGKPRTLEEVMAAYYRADVEAAQELLPRSPFPPETFQQTLSRFFFKNLGLEKEAEELAPPLMKQLVEFRPQRLMVPGAEEVIKKLYDAGYPLGIISNNDGRTREKCEAVGIADYFFFILDSTLEGMMKPDPRMFQKALSMAGVKPFETLHVGDLWGCDVLGARSAGIPAVWLKNDFLRPAPMEGVNAVDNIKELLNLIPA